MTQRAASTVITNFLDQMPADRRLEFERVREMIHRHLPAGYEEVISKNMLVYQVPLARYAETYNEKPLWYMALASEKSYLSLHLMPVYGDAGLMQQLSNGFQAAGKKLDMGKACIHFKRADDLAMDVIGEIVAKIPLERWIEIAQAVRHRSSKGVRAT